MMIGGGILLYVAVHNRLTTPNQTADYRHYMVVAAILGALAIIAGFIVAIDFPRGGVRATGTPKRGLSKRTKEELRIYIRMFLVPTVIGAVLGVAFGSPRLLAAADWTGIGAAFGAFWCLVTFYRPSPITQRLDQKYGPRRPTAKSDT
ncbi:MAG TPA: hypothetical protein VG964_02340 [Candidatus Saccharimonadales bacterium]|nr:hypothetical protein [Candidatus Saccharimonadales bacterium]